MKIKEIEGSTFNTRYSLVIYNSLQKHLVLAFCAAISANRAEGTQALSIRRPQSLRDRKGHRHVLRKFQSEHNQRSFLLHLQRGKPVLKVLQVVARRRILPWLCLQSHAACFQPVEAERPRTPCVQELIAHGVDKHIHPHAMHLHEAPRCSHTLLKGGGLLNRGDALPDGPLITGVCLSHIHDGEGSAVLILLLQGMQRSQGRQERGSAAGA